MARIEFYLGSSAGCLSALEDGAVRRKGEMISIRKTTYKVLRVT